MVFFFSFLLIKVANGPTGPRFTISTNIWTYSEKQLDATVFNEMLNVRFNVHV